VGGIIFIIILYVVISAVAGSQKSKKDAQTRAMQEKLEKEQIPGLNPSGRTQASAAPQQKKAPMQAPVLERAALKSALEVHLQTEGRGSVPMQAPMSASMEGHATEGIKTVHHPVHAAAKPAAYSGRPDIGDLRRMIIMKEILDKPVSLRRKTGAAR